MESAFLDVFALEPTDSFPLAGRTDRFIAAELAARHGLPADDDTIARMYIRYTAHLEEELQRDGPGKGPLPGVRRTLETLNASDDVTLALLTGNLEAGARIKLEYFDLWRFFCCGAFGNDAQDRRALFAVARSRAEIVTGSAFATSSIVVIGDTPFDVEVARAAGVRAVGVATGQYDRAALVASGADVVLPSFEDLEATLAAFGLSSVEGR